MPLTKQTLEDLAKAAKDIVRMNHCEDEERSFRMSQCETCEYRHGTRCDLCGCYIRYKAKLKSSECPIGRWSGFVPETLVDSPGEEHAAEEDSH